MSRRLAVHLVDLAARLLPARHTSWGAAMRVELDHVDDDAAVGFAAGCLWAGARERIGSMTNVVTIGRWTVGVATGLYALLHLAWSATFLPILLGKASDVSQQTALIFIYTLAIGVTHAAAAYYLIRWRARPFIMAWFCAAAVSMTMTIGIFMASNFSFRGLGLQLALLLLLAGAALLFRRWSATPRVT